MAQRTVTLVVWQQEGQLVYRVPCQFPKTGMTLNQLRAVFDRVIYQWTQRLAHLVMVHVTAP